MWKIKEQIPTKKPLGLNIFSNNTIVIKQTDNVISTLTLKNNIPKALQSYQFNLLICA